MESLNLVTFDERVRWPELFGRAFERPEINAVQVDPETFDPLSLPAGSVVVVSQDWAPAFRVGLGAARRAGIPAVYVMDGVIEWSYVWNNQSYIHPEGTFQQPLFTDYLCVIGRRPARYLASLGNGERIRIVGLPRLAPEVPAPRPAGAGARRVLVVTARTFGHNVEQKVGVRRALRDLRDWFEANPAFEPIWRIAEDVAADIDVAPEMQGSFAEALTACDACISFTSTALLEAMRAGRPVAQIEYRTVPLFVETAWTIRSAEQIPSVVQELLHPPANKLAYQNYCLGEELEEGDVAEKLVAVFREAAAAGCRMEPPPESVAVGSGPLDYRLVHSEISAFSVGPLPLAQAELEATYRCLEKSRAEIRRLREELVSAQGDSFAKGIRVSDLEAQQTRAYEELIRVREALCPLSGSRLDDRLEALADRIRGKGLEKVVVCGSGTIGARIVEFLQSRGVEVVAISDRDRTRWGLRIGGVAIACLDEAITKGGKAFVIGSYGSIEQIRADILRQFDGSGERPITLSL